MGQSFVPSHAAAALIALVGFGMLYLGHGVNAPLVAAGLILAGIMAPGIGWARWISARSGPHAAALVLGQAVALAILLVLGLIAVLVGFPYQPLLLAELVGVSLLLALVAGLRPAATTRKLTALGPLSLAGIGLLALALRLPGLGYSELQGDEVEAVLRAGALAAGQPDALFHHGKAPGEVIMSALVYGLAGTVNELAVRLPFAYAGMLAVLAGAQLGAALFGWRAGVLAGTLAALTGYYIAFARILQYQSLVLLFGTAAVLAALGVSRGSYRGLWASGVLLGAGLASHYDAIFAAIPVGMIAAYALLQDTQRGHSHVDRWVAAAAITLLIPALFFVPYANSPLAGQGVDRVTGRVGEIALRNNLGSIANAASLYLSTPFLVGVGVLAVTGGIIGLIQARGARWPWLLTWCWLLVPLLGYGFVVRKPGTHAHVALLPILLLAAAALAWALGAPRSRVLSGVLALGLGLAAVPLAAHNVAVYHATQPEVVRSNLVPQAPLGWFTLPVPRKERFGFPYQAGWKTIGDLYASGRLSGSYDSNENPQITWWYTRGAWRCTADPRYYIIAEQVQDEIEPPRRRIASDYAEIATVTVQGQVKARVHERRPVRGPLIGTLDAADARAPFDLYLASPMDDPGVWARGPISPLATAVGEEFGDAARLEGYRIFEEDPRPGGVIRLDVFWLPHVEGERYVPIVTVGEEAPIATSDGPGCDKSRSWAEWLPSQPFAQRLSLPIPAEARPGEYPLTARLVDMQTGKLVPSQRSGEETVALGRFTIRPN